MRFGSYPPSPVRIRPHDRLWNLNKIRSRTAGQLGVDRLHLHPKHPQLLGGGLLVIHREAWEKVGGYDERFVGWGHEDSDFHTRLLAEASWDRISGQAWHLHHPRDPHRTPERMANQRDDARGTGALSRP